MANDLDYLGARLHGRRGRLAEAGRLDALCRLGTVADLARAVQPGVEFRDPVGFERRLLQDLAQELAELGQHLSGAASAFCGWLVARFQVENLKVLVRGWTTRTPLAALRAYLLDLPRELALDEEGLLAAEGLRDFAARLPRGPLRRSLAAVPPGERSQLRAFPIEAALDRGYLQELLARAQTLPEADRKVTQPMIAQEIGIFLLGLAVRGRFHYGLPAEDLLPLHVGGGALPRADFAAMLADPDARAAAARVVGRILDVLPAEASAPAAAATTAAAVEALAWERFLRLANHAFRRSHMGLGVVAGYAGLRRVEIANLITLAEGIRAGMRAEALRARLIPRTTGEPSHV